MISTTILSTVVAATSSTTSTDITQAVVTAIVGGITVTLFFLGRYLLNRSDKKVDEALATVKQTTLDLRQETAKALERVDKIEKHFEELQRELDMFMAKVESDLKILSIQTISKADLDSFGLSPEKLKSLVEDAKEDIRKEIEHRITKLQLDLKDN